MANEKYIVETQLGSIKIVTFNKPNRKNAIDPNMYIQVTKIFEDAGQDDSISVLVITGTGDYYSSGIDLKATLDTLGDPTKKTTIQSNFIQAFIKFPKILIAIVNGPAIGIAATTLALCDLVFASENSFFYTPFTKLGILAEGCSTYTFPKLIGFRKAVEMLVFNHKMSAKEAMECGFINYVYKPEELKNKVWDKIVEVSNLPKRSLSASKKLLRGTIQEELLKTNSQELEELNKIWGSEEFINTLLSYANRKSKI